MPFSYPVGRGFPFGALLVLAGAAFAALGIAGTHIVAFPYHYGPEPASTSLAFFAGVAASVGAGLAAQALRASAVFARVTSGLTSVLAASLVYYAVADPPPAWIICPF